MKTDLPPLANHLPTLKSLQQVVQILRSVRLAGTEILENELHYSIQATENGASTGILSFGGEMLLDYPTATITFRNGNDVTWRINGLTQIKLAGEVFSTIERARGLSFDTQRITEDTPLVLDSAVGLDYAQAQYSMYTMFNTFRDNLPGYKTPVVLWPHGFDLSFLWFKKGRDERSDQHMNFGFSPGLDRDEPYMYYYAWPTPSSFNEDSSVIGKYESSWSAPGISVDYHTLKTIDVIGALNVFFEQNSSFL